MSSTSQNDTEILLGNRHLLAIFFVLAVLLGIAFTGGYMVGRNSADKKGGTLTASNNDPAASTSSMETHSLTPDTGGSDGNSERDPQTHTLRPPPPDPVTQPKEEALKPPSVVVVTPPSPQPKEETEPAAPAPKAPPAHTRTSAASSNFTGPQKGQMFLQVAAVGRTEAHGLADALSKKGFHAHAVAKPGSTDTFRVLIGPLKDTTELSSTRDSLRNAGFTKIFVQRY